MGVLRDSDTQWYMREEAWPKGIFANEEKYRIIAVRPTAQRRNIVFESLIFNDIPRLNAKATTANAITAERTKITIQTSIPLIRYI